MATRTKILIVDGDLATLSKIYLALVHRNYKVEASDNQEEIQERIKRFKPSLLIIGQKEFLSIQERLKIETIILHGTGESIRAAVEQQFIAIEKPVQIERLMQIIEELTI